MKFARVSFALLCLHLASCGGAAAFANLFPDNKPEHIDLVLDNIGKPGETTEPLNGTGTALAAAVVEGGKAIALIDVEKGQKLWQIEMPVDSAPEIGPGVVVLRSGQDLVGLSIQGGAKLWDRGLEESNYYGAAFDSGLVVITQGNTDGGVSATGRHGIISALDAQTGARKWSMSVDKMLGAPAARGGMAFVPWDRQSLSILDIRSGDELCRLLRHDGTVDWVVAKPEGVFYGSAKDILRLTPRSAAGTAEEGASVKMEVKALPGEPPLYPDTFEGSNAAPGAKARIRLLWHPSTSDKEDTVALADGSIYLLYYRYVIALEAGSGLARWVYPSEKPIAWASAGKGGLFMLDETGAITFVDGATGVGASLGSVGLKPQAMCFDPGAFDPPAEGKPRQLIWGLRDLVFDVDTQVLALRKYALELMAALPEQDVTMDLLEILRSGQVPKALRDQAALMLRTRQGGVEFLEEALKYHANFLEDMQAPPVGAIASSLAASGEKGALPLLLEHLRDHETPTADLVELTEAILVLGDESALPDLEKFLVMYHADSALSLQIDVLVNVAKAIVKFGGDSGKDFVQEMVDNTWTGPILKTKLQETVK